MIQKTRILTPKINFNFGLCKMDNDSKKNWIFQIQFCGQNTKFDAWKRSVFPIYDEGFRRGASKCVRWLRKLMVRWEERSGFVNWKRRKAEVPTCCFWCLYESERQFLRSCCCWIFFERLKSIILLTLFSLFEVKVRPDSAWNFCVDFCQSVSSVSVNVSKSFVCF